MATKQQLAQYCADHFPSHISHGVTMTAIISSVVTLLAGFGIGWYVKGRGLQGVKNDASNAVTSTEAVASEIKAAV